jgi:hypothetical protein
MKCPKCHYVSHDYLDACRKCGIDLVTFKQDIGLLVLQPGMLDLSLVLGGAGADDLFESVDEEVSMPASDEEFDISLDDYAEHPGVRRASAGGARHGRPESGTEITGMDHLTLELDSSDLPAEMTARLRAARVISDEPPIVPMQPPAEPGAITLPRDVTFDMEPESITSELPPAIPHHIVPAEPSPPEVAPEPQATLDVPSLQFDVSHVDLACLTPGTPEAARIDEPGAESASEAVSLADSSGNLVSLPLQDVVLAEDTSTASTSVEHTSEVSEPTQPAIDLRDATTASARTDAARPSAPEETAEATDLVGQSIEIAVEDSVLSVEADEPHREAMGLQASLDLDLSTLAEAEATLSDLAAPTLDEAPFTSADVFMPRPPSVMEEIPTAAETPPEGLLTSSDMFALENLEDPMPPEHLTLELEPPVLPTELASNLLAEAAPTLPPAAPEVPETLTSAGPEPDVPVVEALTFADLDDIALPAHLTLELDASAMASEVSSIILDNLELDNPPGDTRSHLSPHDAQADEEEELLLDLDDLELDDEKPA